MYENLSENYSELNKNCLKLKEDYKELEKSHKKLQEDYELSKGGNSVIILSKIEKIISGKEGTIIETIRRILKRSNS